MNAKVSRALQARFATKIRRKGLQIYPRGGHQTPVGEYVDLFVRLNHLKD